MLTCSSTLIEERLAFLVKQQLIVKKEENLWIKPLYLAELGIARELFRLAKTKCLLKICRHCKSARVGAKATQAHSRKRASRSGSFRDRQKSPCDHRRAWHRQEYDHKGHLAHHRKTHGEHPPCCANRAGS